MAGLSGRSNTPYPLGTYIGGKKPKGQLFDSVSEVEPLTFGSLQPFIATCLLICQLSLSIHPELC